MQVQQYLEGAIECLWRDFGLNEKPNVPKIKFTGMRVPYIAFQHDTLYVSTLTETPIRSYFEAGIIGKYLHSLVNPALYARETYIDHYKDTTRSLPDIRDRVFTVSPMRALVGTLSGITLSLRKNEIDEETALERARELFIERINNPLLGFDIESYGDLGMNDMLKALVLYQAAIEAQALPVAIVFACRRLAPIREIAGAPASDYVKYSSQAILWFEGSGTSLTTRS